MTVLQEIYRKERDSFKLDLALNGDYVVELFSFPNPPRRHSRPESCGLRHLAFEVDSVAVCRDALIIERIICETIRVDEFTGKRFFFIADPDDLPIEFYER